MQTGLGCRPFFGKVFQGVSGILMYLRLSCNKTLFPGLRESVRGKHRFIWLAGYKLQDYLNKVWGGSEVSSGMLL